jgi:hypothetical protein
MSRWRRPAIDLMALLAAQQCLADERMTQIVDAGLRLSTAGNPTQTAAEAVERCYGWFASESAALLL